MSLRVYAYEKCDTCRKALKFLAAHKVTPEVIAIREQPPTVAELRKMLGYVDGDLRKLFNTAGQDYRALDMKTRLPKLTTDEALALLASNGNLVKRPFALSGKGGVVGFREEEWGRFLAGLSKSEA
jgi:arsenate reductase